MTATKHDQTQLIEANPKVDRELVGQALRMLREIRQAGHRSHTFDLAPPYSRDRPQAPAKGREASKSRHRPW